MIFAIQRLLEDHISRRGYNDPDHYAITLAKLYSFKRAETSEDSFLASMRKIRTAFFKANPHIQRGTFERALLILLDAKFKKKRHSSLQQLSPQRLKLQAAASSGSDASPFGRFWNASSRPSKPKP